MSGWLDAWRQSPIWLWGILITFAVLFWLKSNGWRRTQECATAAWAKLKGNVDSVECTAGATSSSTTHSWTRRFRERAHSKFRTGSKWILAYTVLLIIVVLLIALAGRVVLHIRSSFGGLCNATSNSAVVGDSNSYSVSFSVSNPCAPTRIKIKAGEKLKFIAKGELLDRTQEANPDGFINLKWPSKLLYSASTPFRRHISDWFKLMGRIGEKGNETFAIGSKTEYTAKADGELFLYVNDATFGLLLGEYWAWPYKWKIGENTGTIKVDMKLIPSEP